MNEPQAKSRLNEQCAKLRESHVELDDIEGRLTALRARQAVSRLRASAPRPIPTPVTVDVRPPESLDLRTPIVEHDHRSTGAEVVGTVEADQSNGADVRDGTDDDFEKRFAAFAAGENDDSSRRWLDFS